MLEIASNAPGPGDVAEGGVVGEAEPEASDAGGIEKCEIASGQGFSIDAADDLHAVAVRLLDQQLGPGDRGFFARLVEEASHQAQPLAGEVGGLHAGRPGFSLSLVVGGHEPEAVGADGHVKHRLAEFVGTQAHAFGRLHDDGGIQTDSLPLFVGQCNQRLGGDRLDRPRSIDEFLQHCPAVIGS